MEPKLQVDARAQPLSEDRLSSFEMEEHRPIHTLVGTPMFVGCSSKMGHQIVRGNSKMGQQIGTLRVLHRYVNLPRMQDMFLASHTHYAQVPARKIPHPDPFFSSLKVEVMTY